MNSKVLEDLLYSKDHEWVKVEGNKAYIGITDYAQHALGEIVYVELPAEEDEFSRGDAFGVIESVKAASDAYIPFGGTVVEVNEALEDSPEQINQLPYESWLVAIEIADESELNDLMSAKEYEEFCSKED
ncbi:glycine cleavage system protein GcvH [Alkaliphilus peptidifermentans]|uniref:Glycine cleavage system H protein n=1 Tax=Alkaliphilus peptidifermentans DSM 18978 TaxID=1120976 RepID=A0A1G5FGI1_9FIRM|nr:glycine cleavage system protein GcvH [Alkaliphilus peptidifermentans]SCY38346.1 glycine cleavage system H protein [Alkaliphilus peptidifermentans DSM 18978]